LNHRRAAAIGNEVNPRPGHVLEHEAGKVLRTAQAAGADRRLVGICPQPSHKFCQVAARHSVSRNDEGGQNRQQRNRLQVRPKVIGKRISYLVYNVRTKIAEAERVAIGRRAHRPADADAAVRAGNFFNQDWLPKQRLQALSQNAGDSVSRPPPLQIPPRC
jgi:hypothetical protein